MNDAVNPPAFRSREIRLWWPLPLAVIIWLLIVWKFGALLSSPKVEMEQPLPLEARFVELPDPEVAPRKSPEVQPKPLTNPVSKPKIKPRPEASPRAEVAAAKPATMVEPAPEPNLAPPTDMQSYVNAARARHQAAEQSAVRKNAEATDSERPSVDEIRTANIMRNLQPQGTNGVFTIISMSARSATFSFRGWTNNSSNARRELIEVDAGPNGDVERAIVRSMIELIRKYHQGNFNWDSQRLGRVVVQSARVEDNAGLEDFLIREFFWAGAGSRVYGGRK